MSKLPLLTPQKVANTLQKKGFTLDRSRGSHQVFRHPETKRIVVVPFHRKDLPRGTLLEILNRAGIRKEEIKDLL